MYYPLDVEESVMCAFCLATARYYIVFNAVHGQLKAVCDKHKEM